MDRLTHWFDRVAHTRRRASVMAQLASAPRPEHLLVVCHGNLCRSPFAERRLQQRLAPLGVSMQLASAGFAAAGRAPPAEALAAASRYAIDLSSHRAMPATRQAVHRADLILAMDQTHLRALALQFRRTHRVLLLGDFDPAPISARMIRDPWLEDATVFDAVYARVARCVDTLVTAWQQ